MTKMVQFYRSNFKNNLIHDNNMKQILYGTSNTWENLGKFILCIIKSQQQRHILSPKLCIYNLIKLNNVDELCLMLIIFIKIFAFRLTCCLLFECFNLNKVMIFSAVANFTLIQLLIETPRSSSSSNYSIHIK